MDYKHIPYIHPDSKHEQIYTFAKMLWEQDVDQATVLDKISTVKNFDKQIASKQIKTLYSQWAMDKHKYTFISSQMT